MSSLKLVSIPFIGIMALASSSLSALTQFDSHKPVINAPEAITIATDLPVGVPIENKEIVRFLGSASAADAIGHKLIVVHDAPIVFVEGVTPVTFTAVDSTGETVTASTEIRITHQQAD